LAEAYRTSAVDDNRRQGNCRSFAKV